ncbi:DUF6119 family protein [Myroides phaeus]|uniref:Sporadically distributed protein, TIGR04141 family n=1 Tax=Myroides phaeus TaxID=702745 RepID=A0A1G8FQA9_9FLAO|nr:DUF6119 family protein [Myroides phaeus]SDH84267.1 sporadically distributed protein, TIGR04141 family [Myroides phaeus]
MPKFNLYKVNRESKDSLIAKFNNSGLNLNNSEVISNLTFEFYISNNPDAVEIWWVEYYRRFINRDLNPANSVYFGCLLIYNERFCYAVSLGKTHFYLKEFCDSEFGINLAERIIDVENMRLKNSKFYKSKKNKTITSFSNNTSLDYDSGESLHFLKAKTINPNLWGKVASFGHSVQLSLDIEINELPNVIERIEAKLSENPIANFPKAELIRDTEEIQRLDILISEAINDVDPNLGNEEFDLSGVDFIFTENASFQFIKTDIESQVFDELSIENLKNFIDEQEINLEENINNIKVKVIREEGRNFSKPLKTILQFVTQDRETLIDGKWHKFNQSYLNLLNEKVKKITLNHIVDYDYNIRITEDQFNTDRERNGYANLHTENVVLARRYRVEKMDLFREQTLYFVKKGKTQNLNYVIDQAMNTLRLLKNNEFIIEENGIQMSVRKINLWFLIERVNLIQDLSDFDSLIFIMKLNDLHKEVADSGLILECNINYLNRN